MARKLTQEEFENKVKEGCGNDVTILGKYINKRSKIETLCNICGNTWFPTANNLIYGHKCPCNQPKKNISHDDFVVKLNKITDEIEIISRYIGSKKPILCKCKHCGTTWESLPQRLTQGIGINCPSCSCKISLPNRYMFNLLSQLGINFEREKIFEWSENKRYDFFIPSQNLIIEMNGKQHYSGLYYSGNNEISLKEIYENDVYKKSLATQNNIANYIEVDASYSSLNWLKRKILEHQLLSKIFDNCDFEKAYKDSNVSSVVKIAEFYNDGITDATKLVSVMNVSLSTIYQYVSVARKCGLISS